MYFAKLSVWYHADKKKSGLPDFSFVFYNSWYKCHLLNLVRTKLGYFIFTILLYVYGSFAYMYVCVPSD